MSPAPSPALPDPASPDPQAVQAHWRRAARQAEAPWLHGEVARRMGERLGWIKRQPARVLEIGGWLGAGRAVLRGAYPKARLTAVEPTEALRARRAALIERRWWRWLDRGPEETVHRIAADAPLPGPVDLVWSNLGLHWSDDPQADFSRWRAALAPEGFLMFSAFGPDTLRELSALYRSLGWAPPAHRYIDMHDLGDALLHAGLADPVMDMDTLSLAWREPADLLHELRSLGGNACRERPAGCRTPRWRARLEALLAERLRGPDGRLQLSFEIVQGHAFQALPRPVRGALATVSVDQLRASAQRTGRPPGSD